MPAIYHDLFADVAVYIGSAMDTPTDPLARLKEADAIIAGGRLRYDAGLMDQAPRLRVVSRTGIGLDNVSIVEATARKIAVCNAPDAPTISTAEHAIALLMAVARRFKRLDAQLRAGEQHEYFGEYDGLELYGLQLGVIGLGRIGRRVAVLACGLGMKTVAFDPYLSAESRAAGEVELMDSLDALLASSDAVSLHLPLSADTRALLNRERLSRMKRGSILINTSRGGLVDEAALLEVLQSGHLRGAGLDVFKREPPPPDHPLLARDDVVATPHVASGTPASKDRLWRAAIQQAVDVLCGRRPASLVNPEVWTLRPATLSQGR